MSEIMPAGTPSQDGIEYGMHNYQYCKSKNWDASAEGDVDGARSYALDMGYWELRLLAYGAISLEVCALNPGGMDDDVYEEQMMSSQKKCYAMEQFEGFPLNGSDGEKPEGVY